MCDWITSQHLPTNGNLLWFGGGDLYDLQSFVKEKFPIELTHFSGLFHILSAIECSFEPFSTSIKGIRLEVIGCLRAFQINQGRTLGGSSFNHKLLFRYSSVFFISASTFIKEIASWDLHNRINVVHELTFLKVFLFIWLGVFYMRLDYFPTLPTNLGFNAGCWFSGGIYIEYMRYPLLLIQFFLPNGCW